MFNYEIIRKLNDLELLLYRYIMKNSEKVIYMRIRELADQAHVSTTTILRFCKKVNCDGYSEFKVKLKMHIEKNENSTIVSITNSENCTISKISDLNISYYVQQEKIGISDITTQIPVLYMIESIGKRLHNKFIEN